MRTIPDPCWEEKNNSKVASMEKKSGRFRYFKSVVSLIVFGRDEITPKRSCHI